jgi:pilus assembly protein FimV
MDQWGPALVGVGLISITGVLLWSLARYTRRAEVQEHGLNSPAQATAQTSTQSPSSVPPRAAAILSSLDLNLDPNLNQSDQAADALRVKLNLVRAYITIEDYVAARKALEEILLVSNQVDPQITISARGLMAEINQRSDS